jgi:hypothetical protein
VATAGPLRALEERVDDLDLGRPSPERRERVHQPLGRVPAGGEQLGVGALEPVRLVVDDEGPPSGLARDHIEHATDQDGRADIQ